MTSLDARIDAVFLPAEFHRRACGDLCRRLRPAPTGTLVVKVICAEASATDSGAPRVGVFGALRQDDGRWLVAVATADGRWFHGEYTDKRLLRQHRGAAPEPLACVLAAELIVL